MTARRIPIVATIVVLAAVATMIALGFWQLDRKGQKEALLARYAAAQEQSQPVPFDDLLEGRIQGYRRTSWECSNPSDDQVVAGRNVDGAAGFVHVVVCDFDGYDYVGHFALVLGWSPDLAQVRWAGGNFSGVVVPAHKGGTRQSDTREINDWEGQPKFYIVADPPLAGLQANARPDPNDLPNNHLAYAGQWFFFALTALLIYALALRARWRKVRDARPPGE